MQSRTLGQVGASRRRVGWFAVAAAAVLFSVGCTPGTSAPAPAASAAEPEGTVEFWHQFTDRESRAIEFAK